MSDDARTHDPAADALRAVDAAMQSVQAASAGRRFYGPDHAAVRQHAGDALAALRPVDGGKAIRVLLVEGQLHWRGRLLPAFRTLGDGVFQQAARAGVQWLAFDPNGPVEGLLAAVEALEAGTLEVPPDTVRLGTIQHGSEDPRGPLATAAASAAPVVEAVTSQWPDAVQSLAAGDPAVAAGLADRLAELTVAVLAHGPTLLPLLDLKRADPYSSVHAIHVGVLAGSLGRAIGLGDDQVNELTLAGALHDVGKQRVDPAILNFPGRLTGDDLAEMHRHAAYGAAILEARAELPPLAAVVAYEHHMNLDGTGYPNRPRGTRIHPASQIVHVADIFDALRTRRPYRDALPLPRVLDILAQEAGDHIDRDLYDVFAQMMIDIAEADTAPRGDQPLPIDEAAPEAEAPKLRDAA